MSDHNAIYGQDIVVTLAFGAQVDGTKATLTIYVEDKFGAQTSVTAPKITAKDINNAITGVQNDGKTFTFTILAASTDADDKKVHLHVAKGVKEIVPLGSAKSSKEGKLTIDLIGTDDAAGPTVTNMRLGPGVLVPAGGYTGGPFDVIITLSEKPKAFKAADHLDVAEATAADPVALPPIEQQSESEIQSQLEQAGVGSPPRMRDIYDEYPAGQNPVTLANTDAVKADRAKYGGIHRAIGEAATLATAYTYDIMSPATGEALADGEFALADGDPNQTSDPKVPAKVGLAVTKTADTGDLATPTNPSTTLKATERHPGTVNDAEIISYPNVTGDLGVTQVDFPAGTDRTVNPTTPKPSDFTTDAAYKAGLTLFNARRSLYIKYMNEKAVYDAYVDAVTAERDKDQDERNTYYGELFGEPPQLGTGRDGMLHPFVVKITPKYANKNSIVIKVKAFEDETLPTPMKYEPPLTAAEYDEGIHKLTIKIGKEVLTDKTAGLEVVIPKEIRIPASGFTVFAKNNAGSGITDNPGNDKDEPKASERTPAQLKYNLVQLADLPNLETFLTNGGTIALEAPAGVYISEIMWGSDASLSPNNNSQWIEIANTGTSSVLTGDKTHKLWFYGPNETPATSGVVDTVGTVGAGGYWSIAGIGQSGRTGTGEQATDVVAVVPTQALTSMQRKLNADGTPADGTMKSSWGASVAPALNFDAKQVGQRVGTPGAAPVAYPAAPTPAPTPKPATPVAKAADIAITEIMVDTGDGRLPQWIELTNMSGAEVSLAGWSIDIKNSDADADVVGSSVSINLSGTLGVGGGTDAGGTMGKSLLIVAWGARSSSNLKADNIMDVSKQVGETGRYKLISDMAFMIGLVPPQTTGVLTYGDTAGNLDAKEAWDIPTADGARSSLIRREMSEAKMALMGTEAAGWVMASSTSLVTGPATWYGSDEDAGTPGYDAGGPLPVELSMFYPARDKVTGAVVIKWETQSELNNAGFFIKRSQQRSTNFKVINATMIAGAGTTSEKQTYTYTDTTAQPNVVYYYQIEDVSLDGQRQQLTRGIRLRGHIGAAGKATTLWGELKSSNE